MGAPASIDTPMEDECVIERFVWGYHDIMSGEVFSANWQALESTYQNIDDAERAMQTLPIGLYRIKGLCAPWIVGHIGDVFYACICVDNDIVANMFFPSELDARLWVADEMLTRPCRCAKTHRCHRAGCIKAVYIIKRTNDGRA